MAELPPPDFAAWYESEYPRLYATVVLVCRDRAVAEEVAAEAFARAMERWRRVSRMDSPGAWTCRVALNLVRRRHRRAPDIDLVDRADHGDQSTVDVAVDLAAAIAALPPRARAAFVLRFVHDLPERDVAVAMGVRRGTVAALVHQAKTTLRVALAAHAPTPGGETR
jgi:RNA polymerase sigma-70 factor (ECF subfamily)